MDAKLDAVVVEVGLHLLAVEVEDVQVHDGEAALPARVAVGQLTVLGVEDAVEELEVIFDLLVAADGEAVLGRLDRGFHVGHDGQKGGGGYGRGI